MWVSVQQWQKQAQFLPLLTIADRQLLALRHGIVFIVIENLFLWARSEINGYAVDECRGMMENWKDGIMGLKG